MKKAYLIGACLLFALLFFEAALRIAYLANPEWYLCRSRYNGFRGTPGAPRYGHNLNSKGFNDIEYPAAKKSGVYRIVAVGDSLFFSVVPYNFSSLTLIEQKFNDGGEPVEILNMGIPSIGPREFYSLLLHEGLKMNPDMLLVSFYIGDDICEGNANKLMSHAYLASFIESFVSDDNPQKNDVPQQEYCDSCPSLPFDTHRNLESKRLDFFVKNGRFEKNLDYTIGYYRKIKELADHRGIPLLVVIIPDEMQLYPVIQNDAMRLVKGKRADYDFLLPNRLVADKLKKAGISSFDLTPEFMKAAAGGSRILYKPLDTHWNIRGNKVVAGILHRYLSEFIFPQDLKSAQ